MVDYAELAQKLNLLLLDDVPQRTTVSVDWLCQQCQSIKHCSYNYLKHKTPQTVCKCRTRLTYDEKCQQLAAELGLAYAGSNIWINKYGEKAEYTYAMLKYQFSERIRAFIEGTPYKHPNLKSVREQFFTTPTPSELRVKPYDDLGKLHNLHFSYRLGQPPRNHDRPVAWVCLKCQTLIIASYNHVATWKGNHCGR